MCDQPVFTIMIIYELQKLQTLKEGPKGVKW